MRNFVLVILLFLASCNQKDSDDSTIKQKVLELTREYNKVWETLDVEKIAAYHSNESFVYYWHGDLASNSNDHFRKLFPEILETVKSWTVKKTSEPIVQVISKESAIVSFTIESESVLKDGSKATEEGALSYVWKNDGGWKIVHIHDAPQ